MLINAIRYRTDPSQPWQAFRLSPGTGRFRNYQCLSAPAKALAEVMAAISYTLTGKIETAVHEAALALSDDAGDAWTVHRRPGGARYTKNGEPLPEAESERTLLAALLDLENAQGRRPDVAMFDLTAKEDGLSARNLADQGPDPQEAWREMVSRQINEITMGSARALGLAALENPQTSAKLTRLLEPIYAQYRELCQQYKDLKTEIDQPEMTDLEAVDQLAREVALMAEIHKEAEPLLQPGVTLKTLKDELQTVDTKIAETCASLGLDRERPAGESRDLRKPVEASARLEAYARLVRASQGARKYCEQNVEPQFLRYLETAESHLTNDRQIIAELESCIATLSLRMRARGDVEDKGGAVESTGLKTWFERFKARGQDAVDDKGGPSAEEDTARMALEYALTRLTELASNVGTTRARHEAALARMDHSHEELVRNYGRLKDHWALVAKEAGLAEDMDLSQLLGLVTGQAQLNAAMEHRHDLAARIRKLNGKMAKLERLVLEWRIATGSQKTTDLTNPAILLQEAQAILRYQEAKTKKLQQLRDIGIEAKARLGMQGLLKTRRRSLLAEWEKAFKDISLAPHDINHEAWPEAFRRASVVRALALVHGSANRIEQPRLFDPATEHCAATIYRWVAAKTDNHARLALLGQLEAAAGGELRLLLVEDEGLAGMLGSLGIGSASRLTAEAAEPTGTQALAKAKPVATPPVALGARPPHRPGAVPTAVMAPIPKPAASARQPASVLNERAQHALDILTGKKSR